MDIIEIYSKGNYPANILSNFSDNSFVLDGVECKSMEGFLQSLKYRNIEKQKAVCCLVGSDAKAAGKKKFLWKLTGNLYWRGQKYKRNSTEFDSLRLRAYEAMLSNDTFRVALQCTKGKILKHSMGENNKRKTILTEKEFLFYLNHLREKV